MRRLLGDVCPPWWAHACQGGKVGVGARGLTEHDARVSSLTPLYKSRGKGKAMPFTCKSIVVANPSRCGLAVLPAHHPPKLVAVACLIFSIR